VRPFLFMSFRNFDPCASRRLLDSIVCEKAQKDAAVLEILILQPSRKLVEFDGPK